MNTGCSPVLFLSVSQRLEMEGDSLQAADRISEAILAFHQAALADPSNYSALKKIIPLYQQLGRMREADAIRRQVSKQENSDQQITPKAESPQELDNLKFQWLKTPSQDVPVGLSADTEIIVVAYRNGQIASLRIDDGTSLWSVKLNEVITAAPVLSDTAVLLGCESGNIIAL
ncbi:MAG TPA: PQQ-binding-like beta-propeller repeat protein, partial [Leptolinea sp.]